MDIENSQFFLVDDFHNCPINGLVDFAISMFVYQMVIRVFHQEKTPFRPVTTESRQTLLGQVPSIQLFTYIILRILSP